MGRGPSAPGRNLRRSGRDLRQRKRPGESGGEITDIGAICRTEAILTALATRRAAQAGGDPVLSALAALAADVDEHAGLRCHGPCRQGRWRDDAFLRQVRLACGESEVSRAQASATGRPLDLAGARSDRRRRHTHGGTARTSCPAGIRNAVAVAAAVSVLVVCGVTAAAMHGRLSWLVTTSRQAAAGRQGVSALGTPTGGGGSVDRVPATEESAGGSPAGSGPVAGGPAHGVGSGDRISAPAAATGQAGEHGPQGSGPAIPARSMADPPASAPGQRGGAGSYGPGTRDPAAEGPASGGRTAAGPAAGGGSAGSRSAGGGSGPGSATGDPAVGGRAVGSSAASGATTSGSAPAGTAASGSMAASSAASGQRASRSAAGPRAAGPAADPTAADPTAADPTAADPTAAGSAAPGPASGDSVAGGSARSGSRPDRPLESQSAHAGTATPGADYGPDPVAPGTRHVPAPPRPGRGRSEHATGQSSQHAGPGAAARAPRAQHRVHRGNPWRSLLAARAFRRTPRDGR